MNEDQFKIFLKSNEEATGKAIQKFVNGKVDKMIEEQMEQNIKMNDHIRKDEDFQRRSEPMLRVFEENNIVKMKFRNETNTLVFYAKSALTIAALGSLVWGIIKFFSGRG